MDRIFPFEATNDALAYVDTGRSVTQLRDVSRSTK
jgi:hypothetical protein